MRSPLKFLKILFAMAAVSFAIGVFLMVTLMNTRQTRIEADHLTDAEFALMAKDLRRIHDLGVFPPSPAERDAGALLNPFIATSAAPADEAAWWADAGIRDAVNAGWLVTDEALPEGELSLLAELLAYDHWEAASSGAYGRFVAANPMPLGLDAPLPELLPLVTLARLRLGEGLRAGDVLPALEETRHLARLVYADESLLGSMIAVKMLSLEREAFEAALAAGDVRASEWAPVSEADVEAMQRVVYGVTFVLRGGAGSDGYALLGELGVPIFSLCGAATETAMDVVIRRAILHEPAPFEPSYEHLDALVMSAIGDERCRVPEARKTLGDGYDRERILDQMFSVESGERELLVPYVRSWIYATLFEVITLGNPYRDI